MRRFRFRLQPLLRLRSQFERLGRKQLAVAMAEVNGIGQQVSAARQGLSDCADQASRSDPVGALARALENGLRRHVWRLQQQQQVAEQKLDRARGEYARQARELKTLQKLKEQQREDWRQERQRHEQAEIDAAAVMRSVQVEGPEGESW